MLGEYSFVILRIYYYHQLFILNLLGDCEMKQDKLIVITERYSIRGSAMMKNKVIGGMLTVREVSQLLHVHSNTLRRWSDQGIVKTYRIGPRGDRRFKPEDIAVLLLEENRGIPLDISEPEPMVRTKQFAVSR